MKKIIVLMLVGLFVCSLLVSAATIEPKKELFKISTGCADFEEAEYYYNLSKFIKSDVAETPEFTVISNSITQCAVDVEGAVLVAFPAIPASGTVRIKAVTEDYGACEFDLYIEFVRMSDWLLKWIIWTAVICAVILLLGYIVLFVRPYSHTLHIAPVDSAGAIKAESVYVNGFSLLPISMKNVKSNAKKITSPDKLKYWDELNLNGFFYSAGNKGVRFIPEKRVFVVQSAGEPPKEKRAVTIAKNSHITVYSDSFHTRGIEIKYN